MITKEDLLDEIESLLKRYGNQDHPKNESVLDLQIQFGKPALFTTEEPVTIRISWDPDRMQWHRYI